PFPGQRLGRAGTALASTEGARSLLRLPIIKNGRAIGIVKIISVADRLRPIRALAIGDARHPRSGRAVAAIAQPYAGRDLYENRLFGDRQPQPSRASFQRRRPS